MDKNKEKGIRLEREGVVEYCREVMKMPDKDPEMLNHVYRDISEKLGVDTAMSIFQMFRGQQITFPMKFFNPERIHKYIISEYDGTNIKLLATKYGYSEKSIRRIIKNSTKK